LAVNLVDSKSYVKFHNALMKGSARTEEDALNIAKGLGINIVKVKGGYELKSKHGNKNLGKYPTKAGAEKRERQVQYFKHAGK
jgi:hypothetical protein